MKLLVPVLLCITFILTGCATPARMEQMVAPVQPAQRVVKTPLRDNVAVTEVTGGKETNPMCMSNVSSGEFERALETSLRDVGLLSNGKQAGKYVLVANMEKLDQPFIGISMTVTASVQYTVIDRASRKEIFSRTIAIPYTASFGDAFLGTERLKMANEGAIRVNIAALINELFSLKLDAIAIQ